MRSNSPSSHTGIGSSVVGCTAPGFFSSKSRAHCGNFLAIGLPRSRASSTRIEMGGYYVWSYKMDRRAPRNGRSYPIRFVHRLVISGTIHSAERQNWRHPTLSPKQCSHQQAPTFSSFGIFGNLKHFRHESLELIMRGYHQLGEVVRFRVFSGSSCFSLIRTRHDACFENVQTTPTNRRPDSPFFAIYFERRC